MLRVRSKGGICESTSIAKRKKNYSAAAVRFWGGLSAQCHDKSKLGLRSTSRNSSFTSGPPTFLSEGRTEVFFTWSYTNYIQFSCLQCNTNAVKGERGIPREHKHCPNYFLISKICQKVELSYIKGCDSIVLTYSTIHLEGNVHKHRATVLKYPHRSNLIYKESLL